MSRRRNHRLYRVCCLLLLLCSLLQFVVPGAGNAAGEVALWSVEHAACSHEGPVAAADHEEPALLPVTCPFLLPSDQTVHQRQPVPSVSPGTRPLITPPE